MAQMKALGSALPLALVDCFPGRPSPPWLPGGGEVQAWSGSDTPSDTG